METKSFNNFPVHFKVLLCQWHVLFINEPIAFLQARHPILYPLFILSRVLK